MPKYNILIVEDEMLIAESLRITIKQYGFNIAGVVNSKSQALDFFKTSSFDIAFLDIRLKLGTEGIELANYINDNLKKPFVFLTSFSDKSIVDRAIQTLPSAYLHKPFTDVDIYTVLKLVTSKLESSVDNKEFITVSKNSILVKIYIEDILYIKVDNIYIEIVTKNKTFVKRISFEKQLNAIEAPKIIRVHRSYAVNVTYYTKIDQSYIYIDKYKIPLSARYKKRLSKSLNF